MKIFIKKTKTDYFFYRLNNFLWQAIEIPGINGWHWEVAVTYTDALADICLYGSTVTIQKLALMGGNKEIIGQSPRIKKPLPLPSAALFDLTFFHAVKERADGGRFNTCTFSWDMFSFKGKVMTVLIHEDKSKSNESRSHDILHYQRTICFPDRRIQDELVDWFFPIFWHIYIYKSGLVISSSHRMKYSLIHVQTPRIG